jgi:glutamyl-tRNA reductase
MADASSQFPIPYPDSEELDPEWVLRAIQRQSCDVERRELDYALSRLDARGDMSDKQELVLSELADAIVAEILAGPEAALADADPETVRAARELFSVRSPDDRP